MVSVLVRIVLLCGVLVPLGLLVAVSGAGIWRWPQLLAPQWSWDAWTYVLFSPDTWQAVWTGGSIALVVTVLNLLVCWPAADALTRGKVGRDYPWMEALLYVPIVVTGFLPLMGLHRLFIRFDLADSYIAVVLVTWPVALPYMLRPLMAGFATFGVAWEEQGRMLGAKSWQSASYIVLPQLAPSIAMGCGLSMVVAWSQHIIPFLLGGGQVRTVSMVMMPFLVGGEWGIGASYAVLYTAGACVLFWVSGAWVRKGWK